MNKLVAPSHQGAHARVIDLLWHLPVAVIDRAITPNIAAARIGDLATLDVTVAEHRGGGGRRGGKAPYKVLVEDDAGGAFDLVYFNADPVYLKRLLPVGSRRLV
ncbi:MAG: ATP-dependent DNA helicase RecG, partial [Methyloceanibacter sp.]